MGYPWYSLPTRQSLHSCQPSTQALQCLYEEAASLSEADDLADETDLLGSDAGLGDEDDEELDKLQDFQEDSQKLEGNGSGDDSDSETAVDLHSEEQVPVVPSKHMHVPRKGVYLLQWVPPHWHKGVTI